MYMSHTVQGRRCTVICLTTFLGTDYTTEAFDIGKGRAGINACSAMLCMVRGYDRRYISITQEPSYYLHGYRMQQNFDRNCYIKALFGPLPSHYEPRRVLGNKTYHQTFYNKEIRQLEGDDPRLTALPEELKKISRSIRNGDPRFSVENLRERGVALSKVHDQWKFCCARRCYCLRQLLPLATPAIGSCSLDSHSRSRFRPHSKRPPNSRVTVLPAQCLFCMSLYAHKAEVSLGLAKLCRSHSNSAV